MPDPESRYRALCEIIAYSNEGVVLDDALRDMLSSARSVLPCFALQLLLSDGTTRKSLSSVVGVGSTSPLSDDAMSSDLASRILKCMHPRSISDRGAKTTVYVTPVPHSLPWTGALVCDGASLSEDDRVFLNTVAESIGVFLRAKAAVLPPPGVNQASKRIQEVSAIYEISQAFDRVPINALLKLITEKAAEVMDAHACSLMLKLPEKDELTIKASFGLSDEIIEETRVVYGEGVAGRVAETGRPMLLTNLQNDPRFANVVPKPDIISSICVPLRDAEGQVQGVLNIRRKSPSLEFDADDVKVFSVFASQAALAISNAQLYSTLKARVQELSLLYEAGRELSAAYSLENASDALVRVACRVADGVSAILLLWDELGGARVQASSGVTSELCDAVAQSIGARTVTWLKGLRETRSWLLENQGRRPSSTRQLVSTLCGKFSWVSLVPLVAEDAVIGVLILGDESGRPMEQRKTRLLSVTASQAATIIRNAGVEKEIRRISELAAIGQLAANIAHEIRNPLSSIKGAAQYLRNEYADHVSLSEFLDIIIEEVNVLNGITTEFLDFARPGNLNCRETDVNDLVSRTLQFMEAEIARHGVEPEFQQTIDLPMIYADERQLQQALRNVVLNALQAMPGGGCLTITTSMLKDGVGVAISDTGVGISEKDLDQVFTPFFTTKTKGTGLGLSIVRKIIENHRGRVTVTSGRGEGTVFSILLPVVSRSEGRVLMQADGIQRIDEVDLFRRSGHKR